MIVRDVRSGVGGGSAAAAATTFSHDLSTAVFLATVVALAWVARRNVED